MVWANPLDYTLDLRDLMDDHYGAGAWTMRTGVNIGSDIAPALTLGFVRLRTGYGYGTVRIPPGAWMMKTALNPAQLSGISLQGAYEGASLIFWSGTGNCLEVTGAGGYGGVSIERLGIFREDGTSGGVGILLRGDAQFQPDQYRIENIYMTAVGTGRWGYNLLIDGLLRTSPQGIRVFNHRNLQLFQSGQAGAYAVGIFNAVQGHISNIGTYGGTGALANNVYVGGAAALNTKTNSLTIDRLNCGGELNLTNLIRGEFRGSCAAIAFDATCNYAEGWLNAGSIIGAPGPSTNITIR